MPRFSRNCSLRRSTEPLRASVTPCQGGDQWTGLIRLTHSPRPSSKRYIIRKRWVSMLTCSRDRLLMSRGFSAGDAEAGARRMLSGLVAQQAMILSFEKLFMLAGILFLCVLPLVLFLRAPKLAGPAAAKEKPVDVHIEV